MERLTMEEIEHLKARVKCNNCGYDLDVPSIVKAKTKASGSQIIS